ncbi:hypothetical protein Dda_6549 [Drechslerella dactyloides]|uniref:F-box domain-containing protein n=1 Tax=Drechslerella dactyloides TaxID=74499 RepID=A0AAD6NGB0_DREDA|nr:hypothetical protein Dda_6549 [Drechslerella dactyloides]
MDSPDFDHDLSKHGSCEKNNDQTESAPPMRLYLPLEIQYQILEAASIIQYHTLKRVCRDRRNFISRLPYSRYVPCTIADGPYKEPVFLFHNAICSYSHICIDNTNLVNWEVQNAVQEGMVSLEDTNIEDYLSEPLLIPNPDVLDRVGQDTVYV